MTVAASDPLDWQQHIETKKRRDNLTKWTRNPDYPLRFVIVYNMCLMDFDALCLNTISMDKPMRGHGFM